MLSRQEYIRRLKAHAETIVEDFGVRSLCLFGSVVRNEQNESSDIDIFVDMEPDFLKVAGLKHYKGFHISGLSTLIYPTCICENGYATIISGIADKILVPEETQSPLAKKILEAISSQNDNNPIIVYYDIK